MTRERKISQAAAAGLFLILIAAIAIRAYRTLSIETISLAGVVIRQDADPRRRMPIANVSITATSGQTVGKFKSDPAGYFHLTLNIEKRKMPLLTLRFRQSDYHPLEMTIPATTRIYVVRMLPITAEQRIQTPGPDIVITDVRVRYSMKATNSVNVGSLAKTFQVFNSGGLPCNARSPCSPDAKWKASSATKSFDAGQGNQFGNIRVSCIAGPCPFTTVQSQVADSGRILNVVAVDWSETATFLVEAEVNHRMISDTIRQSVPVVFGDGMNFSLPATGQGPSVEAALNGADIVFPLGPDVLLPWATCSVKVDADRSKLYRCELKPGYRFES